MRQLNGDRGEVAEGSVPDDLRARIRVSSSSGYNSILPAKVSL